MIFLVDSSVIIAAFRKDEIYHQQALNILKSSSKIIILDLVLSEILTIIKMKENMEAVKKVIDFLINNKDIIIEKLDKNQQKKVLNFFKTNHNKLSFVDTALLIFGKNKKLNLLTFDKELGKKFANSSTF